MREREKENEKFFFSRGIGYNDLIGRNHKISKALRNYVNEGWKKNTHRKVKKCFVKIVRIFTIIISSFLLVNFLY